METIAFEECQNPSVYNQGAATQVGDDISSKYVIN